MRSPHAASGSRPSAPHTLAADGSAPVAWLEAERIGRRFHARDGERWWELVALRECSFRIPARRCVLVTGDAPAPFTTLAVVAGLIRPGSGTLRWCDARGRPVAPPSRRLIGATWRPHDCLSVRDVLEAAVPHATWQAGADRRIGHALHCCALGDFAAVRAGELDAERRVRVAVAAALVAGARWILVEIAHSLVAEWQSIRRRLAHCGITLLVAGDAELASVLDPELVIRVRGRAAVPLPDPAPTRQARVDPSDGRRVAEAGVQARRVGE